MEKLTINEKTLNMIKSQFEEGIPIAVPTDTNYNLMCDPHNKEAIKKIFEYKKRSFDKPLSLFLYNPDDIHKYAKDYDYRLLEAILKKFLPGPLNIVLNKNTNEFDLILNGVESIAFGSISNYKWRSVVKYINKPVAITSANISGAMEEGLVTEEVLKNQMGNKLKYYIEDIKKESTKSSTIIKIEKSKIILLRKGDISIEEILRELDKKGVYYEYEKIHKIL